MRSEFIERFNNEGGPIPEVDPDHLKKIWKAMKEIAPRLNETTGG